ncbi:MAG: SDR family oxidoreductase, partial [Lachnospiraceae bacterium]|nr:SDR family oxidoreductase [Lachnospiraceae bacterium]
KRMADEGSNVVIAGRTEEKLKNAVRKIGKDICTYITADISMVNEHDRYFREAEEQMGGLDAFVNAAAISLESRGRGYEPWDINEEEWDEMSDTDFKAAFFLMRNEVNYLRGNGILGNILNIASNAPFMDVTGLYGASKQAVIRWTRSFGKRFGHDGIIINGIAPGITATSFVSDYIIKNGSSFPRHAIERIIMPEEVAELAAYCLGDRGVILCGCTVVADGGDAEAVF